MEDNRSEDHSRLVTYGTPLRAFALPEAAFTGSLLALFASLTGPGAVTDQRGITWMLVVATIALAGYALYAGLSVRSIWPWRWKSAVAYCAAMTACLFLINNGVGRSFVIVGLVLYSIDIYHRLAKPVQRKQAVDWD